MRLRVLGCSGAEFPGHNPSAFLIDGSLLLDGGTIGAVLDEEEQCRIGDILVTHPHLDHIRGIPLFADNMVIKGLCKTVNVVSTKEIISIIASHLMNGLLWPDFTKIPSAELPVLRYLEVTAEAPFPIGGDAEYSVTAYPVKHTVPAVAYRITKGSTTILYTGDTGPTDGVWERAGELSALLVEVSFPNDMEQTALLTGHLTPQLLAKELRKLPMLPHRILVTHLKPQYHDVIVGELDALSVPGLSILRDGDVYDL